MRPLNWPLIVPLVALGVLAVTFLVPPNAALLLLYGAALLGAVISAVHHAEVVAHRLGEPFGTLVLALAVTVIEAALVLLHDGDGRRGERRHRSRRHFLGGDDRLQRCRRPVFARRGSPSPRAVLSNRRYGIGPGCPRRAVHPGAGRAHVYGERARQRVYDPAAHFRCDLITGAVACFHLHTNDTTSRLLPPASRRKTRRFTPRRLASARPGQALACC